MARPLNLASRPFRNRRPVRRVALLLWVLAIAALAVNAHSYWRYFRGGEERRTRLAIAEDTLQAERTQIEQLERQLNTVELDRVNEEIAFLNSRIEERTFSWSELFDHLGAVLPADVQLVRLTPKFDDSPSRRSSVARDRARRSRIGVLLVMNGQARQDQHILELVDALFKHPSFEAPDLSSEAKEEAAGVFSFQLQTMYLPGGKDSPTPADAEPS